MPARVRKIRHDEDTRSKIRAGNIINRLCKHIDGEVDMSSTQVRAALGLLAKVLPDLQNVQAAITDTRPEISERPLTAEEWERQFTRREH